MAERITLREFVAGTAVLVATSSERLQLSERASGVVDILSLGRESVTFSEYVTATIEGRGVSRESILFTERMAGAVAIQSGLLKETFKFSEYARAGMWGLNRESILFSEQASGVSLILGTSREAVSFSEKIRGAMVETSEGVWVVNLFHGGHSRYAGDLTGVLPVDAYAVTPACQLGVDQAKFAPDVYAHLRASGSMSVTAIVDEQLEVAGEVLTSDGREGMHRRRVKMPLGARGVNWQLKIANIEGADFTVKSLEVTPIGSRRVT